jgi:hypothetical protein
VSEPQNPSTGSPRTGFLDGVLHLSGGFSATDRHWVLDALSGLEPHLSRWDPAAVQLFLSVQDRDGKEQTVTLRAELPGYPPIVAKAADRDLNRALAEVKRALVHQVEDEKKKREPENNRLLRKKTG